MNPHPIPSTPLSSASISANQNADPHAVHSDYSSEYLAIRRNELPVTPRPGRGRPRKITSSSTHPAIQKSVMPKRTTPRSSLAPQSLGADAPGGPLLVFKCPVSGCERIFATKLALKRHFQVYQHEAIFDGPLEPVLVVKEQDTPEDKRSTSPPVTKMLPKLYKCPVLQCQEKFPTENELASHWRYAHPVLKGALGEWSSLLYEFDGIALTPVEHPATFLKEIESNPEAGQHWQFLSIFQLLGPQPSLKVSQVISRFRNLLAAAFQSQSAVLIVDEILMGLMVQLLFHELMPRGFLLTRDVDPVRAASSPSYDVWNDEPWLRAIEAESAQTLLQYGSAHTSRAFKRKAPSHEGVEEPSEVAVPTNVEDRFVCQVPGCAKVFASLPAYKYHMHHYEHDLEILIRCSRLLRRVLFAPLVPGEELPAGTPAPFLPERWTLRFQMERFDTQNGLHRSPICDRIICLPDVVHILHGYIDQQLPVLFSFHFTKKRGSISYATTATEFAITMKRDEDLMAIRRDLVEMLSERRNRDIRRKPTNPGEGDDHLEGTGTSVMISAPGHTLLHPHRPYSIALESPGFLASPGRGLATGDELDSSQRSHISLLCKFVVPLQLDLYQSRRFLATIGGIPPGTTGSATQPLAISPVPSGLRAISFECAREVELSSESFPINLRVLGTFGENPQVLASSVILPNSGLHLSATDAVAYGDGRSFSSMDFFPLIAWQGEFGVAWMALGGGSNPSDDSEKSSLFIWSLFLSFDSMALGYRMAAAPQLVVQIEVPLHYSNKEEGTKDTNESDLSSVVAVRWCPFIFTYFGSVASHRSPVNHPHAHAHAYPHNHHHPHAHPHHHNLNHSISSFVTSESSKALLSVLHSSGSISILCLETRMVLCNHNSQKHHWDIPIPDHQPECSRVITAEPLCRLTIPSYVITCFCWCKVPGMPLRIVAGTREGYIALFDLSSLDAPALILMSPGHPTLVASIDWSSADPNKHVFIFLS